MEVEDAEDFVEGVEDDNSKESDKGPVWRVDSIPQLDGTSEASENNVDKYPELIEKLEVIDFNQIDDVDDSEDAVSKILHDINIHVTDLQITMNLKSK